MRDNNLINEFIRLYNLVFGESKTKREKEGSS